MFLGNKSFSHRNLKRENFTDHHEGDDDSDAATPGSSLGSRNTVTRQGSVQRREERDTPPAHSAKRHRGDLSQSEASGSLEDDFLNYYEGAVASCEAFSAEPVNWRLHDRELTAILAQLAYPEDVTQLTAEFYDEVLMEAKRLVMQDETTPPPPTPSTSSEAQKGSSQSISSSQGTGTPVQSKRSWECPFVTTRSCRVRAVFKCSSDRDNHILFAHLSISIVCTNPVHSPASIGRPNRVPEHMTLLKCLGPVRYHTLKRKYAEAAAERLGLPPDDRDGLRAVHQEYVRIRMPCFQRQDVKEAMGALWMPRTVEQLEESLRRFGKVERCTCGPCSGQPRPGLAGSLSSSSSPGTSPTAAARIVTSSGAGKKKVRRKVAVEDAGGDERLPPEEEEGVDEEPAGPPSTVHECNVSPHAAEMDDVSFCASDTDAASEGTDVTDPAIRAEDTAPGITQWRPPHTGPRMNFGIFATRGHGGA